MTDFTRTDVHAIWFAMIEAREQAKERVEKMPSSSMAMDQHANDLKAVLAKILDQAPADVRESYSRYANAAPADLSPAQIEERYGGDADIARESKRT